MHSEGVSSVSKRSAGGVSGRSERSSTQGVFVPNGVEDRAGVAPKCHCGVYAVLYMSRTTNNPNRLFFGCPFFRATQQHPESRPEPKFMRGTSRLCVAKHDSGAGGSLATHRRDVPRINLSSGRDSGCC
ncbi:hypothetical protein PIB30_019249 [Stylosanthes scabra]|uniref:Zinc finger GRF-type domain-containing protein n=1 Tax=Stylosanthes scabra TaxID=79078 RepID=A0ABU6R8G3_9FABA|nr:hypothetical protein [Stylosanthes scabra]